MSKHTPGPWRVGDAGATVFGPKREDGSLPTAIARVRKSWRADLAGRANAHLIAAAPELLAALEGLFQHCAMIHKHWGESCNAREAANAIDAARAAIAKAKGGAA